MNFSQSLDVFFLLLGYVIEIAWILAIVFFMIDTSKRLKALENKVSPTEDYSEEAINTSKEKEDK